MSSRIWYVGDYSIADGKTEEFKSIIQEVIDLERSASDVLVYEFFLDDDESKFHAIESFKDSDSVLQHMERGSEIIPRLLEVADVTRFEIYGDATQELRDAVGPFGAKIFPRWDGFTRSN